jgi:A/G-specific adenine glycosylase
MHKITKNLLEWYNVSQRDLPWRNVNDPYKIWLSEVILQQTRVDQGTQYYLRFIENYPSVHDLANAPEEEVLKLWQGLGYYSRARNLHKAAQEVCREHKGIFPNTAHELVKLRGIGPYTAAAVASIAYNDPVPVVDGNVNRVITRLFNIHAPIDKADGKGQVLHAMQALLPPTRPGEFNQAVMELGALICAPKNPQCTACPVQSFCLALSSRAVLDLPVKSLKTKVTDLYMHYIVIQMEGDYLVRQRVEPGIWHNLYDFPSAEGANPKEALTQLQNVFDALPESHNARQTSEESLHLLSHRRLHITFHVIHYENAEEISWPNTRLVSQDALMQLPVPRIIEKFLPFIFASSPAGE